MSIDPNAKKGETKDNTDFENEDAAFENDDEWDEPGDNNPNENDGWGDIEDVDMDQGAVNLHTPTTALKPMRIVEVSNKMIEDEQQKVIDSLADELNLGNHQSSLLLRKFKWNMPKIIDAYFSKPQQVLVEAGVYLEEKKETDIYQKKSGMVECGICMDDVEVNSCFALDCGHRTTCHNCWLDYLLDGVKTKECVNLPCPAYKCYVVIPSEVWKQFLAGTNHDASYIRYLRFCRDNFIEHSKLYTFCPGKNCEKIYIAESGIPRAVVCKGCGYNFCWACKNEAHFPASCHIAQKWLVKCSSEAENLSWILAKTKRCPKCKVHIEKNQGCNHMTCRKTAGGCGHEFCWLCKGDWSKHGSVTGGYYQCNVYDKNKKDGNVNEEEKAAADAQSELDRYEFHWTRFDSHSKSHKLGRQKTGEETTDKMYKLASKFSWRLSEAQFLMDAVVEASQCWHVLAWTYPIAYYLDAKKCNVDLFKTFQAQMESFCDGLQEKLDFQESQLGDIKVRQEMIGYTRTAKKYRNNLVEHIENEISI